MKQKKKSKVIVLSFRRKQMLKDITNMPFKKQLKYYDIRRDNIRKQLELGISRKELMRMYKLNYQNLYAITADIGKNKTKKGAK